MYLAPALRFGFFLDITMVFSSYDIVIFISYLILFYIFDLYNLVERYTSGPFVIRCGAAILIADIFIALFFFFAHISGYSLGIMFITSILVFFFCLSWRIVFSTIHKNTRQPRLLVIYGTGAQALHLYDAVKNNLDYKLIGFLDEDRKKWGIKILDVPILGGYNKLDDLVKEGQIDIVIVSATGALKPEVYKKLIEVKFSGVDVYEMPTFYEMITASIPVRYLSDMWLTHTTISGVRRSLYTLRIKRVLDIFLSTCGIVLCVPLLLFISVIIKLESPGPAFFIQRRVGWHGKPFDLIKLRTMKTGLENDRSHAGNLDDPRITHIGRLLRLLRLDELPQLYNVFKGEMSFIGPRALMEEEVREFAPLIPYFALRHTVRPGITGWAQVNYPHGATLEDALEKLQYDLYYLKNMSLLLDLHILLRTVRVVLFGKGAR